jgi:hypothetical protein
MSAPLAHRAWLLGPQAGRLLLPARQLVALLALGHHAILTILFPRSIQSLRVRFPEACFVTSESSESTSF